MVFSSYIKTQVKTLSCIISVAMTLGSIILISEDKEKAIIVDNSLEYIADLTLRRETILFYYERRNCHESIKIFELIMCFINSVKCYFTSSD